MQEKPCLDMMQLDAEGGREQREKTP